MSRVYLSGNEDDSAGPDIPWESKLEFIRNAVIDAQEPNLVAVNCLMGSWAFRNLPRDVARGEMARIDTRLKYAPDGSRTKQILRRTEVALAMFS